MDTNHVKRIEDKSSLDAISSEIKDITQSLWEIDRAIEQLTFENKTATSI
jgi:hypothetical protein